MATMALPLRPVSSLRPRRPLAVALAATAALAVLAPAPVAAHTETDVVAVPAGAEATVTLRPTHGCDGSPTVEVAIQAPVEGATAGEVSGWTATAEADGRGNTVLEWTGGSLPADATGAFPVAFTVPDTVGELLVFPSVQECEDGETLSWIDGDPAAEYPAPRLLVLAAGSEPAASIDDVPADAPGRDLLVAVVDVDNPAASTTTGPAGTDATAVDGSAPATDETVDATTDATVTSGTDGAVPADGSAGDEGDEGDDGGVPVAVIAIALLAVAGVVAGVVLRDRQPRSAD
jgi:uncharacterized protein YcnI